MKNGKRSITVHSTATHGEIYLVELIDIAVWLLRTRPGVNNVEIILHPIWSIDTLYRYLQRIIQSYRRPDRAWMSRTVRVFKSRLCNLKGHADKYLRWRANQVPLSSEATATQTSIFERIYKLHEAVSIATELGKINIRKSDRQLVQTFARRIQLSWRARRLWIETVKTIPYDPQRLLTLRYRGIHIGDVVASYALRSYASAGGSLKSCNGVYSVLINAVALCDYIFENILPSADGSYITVPEPTYLHKIIERAIYGYDAWIIQTIQPQPALKLVSSSVQVRNPLVVTSNKSKQLTADEKSRVIAYMHERIADPKRVLSYMWKGTSENDILVNQSALIDVQSQCEGVNAVTYLHSFDDGQYSFGLDGFDDIYEWTIFTIDVLLENTDIERVLIKPHPNALYGSHSADRVALEALRKRYRRKARVVFLPKYTNLNFVAAIPNNIVVTHHGSIAEEMCFLGVPVVASSHAQWGDQFDFLTTWTTPAEYKVILKNIKAVRDAFAPEVARDNLYKYIHEYIIEEIPRDQRASWIKFDRCNGGEEKAIDLRYQIEVERRIAMQAEHSEEFQRFLSFLVTTHTGCTTAVRS